MDNAILTELALNLYGIGAINLTIQDIQKLDWEIYQKKFSDKLKQREEQQIYIMASAIAKIFSEVNEKDKKKMNQFARNNSLNRRKF